MKSLTALLLSVALGALALCGPNSASAERSLGVTRDLASPRDPMALYQLHCGPCHGEHGRGNGPAGRFLNPEPRDFTRGRMRLVSTENRVASDDDLLAVIANGIPGTAMLSFSHLPKDDLVAIVSVLRAFHRKGASERLAEGAESKEELLEWVAFETTPGDALAIPTMTPDSVDARFRGRLLYQSACATCHGPTGRGVVNPEQKTDEGYPAIPRDLSHGVLKGGTSKAHLFTRIRLGLPGTPMPSVPPETLLDHEVWDLVHFLGTMIPNGAQELFDQTRQELRVKKLEGELPKRADDPRFDVAPEYSLPLAPFDSQESAIFGLLVRALHDGRYVVFSLRYADPVRDLGTNGLPPDGVAVRITDLALPPVLPIPGQPLPLDRALFTAGPFPEPDSKIFDPPFRNPDNVCKAPTGPERIGNGRWVSGVWSILMPAAPERAGPIQSGGSMPVSFSVFDGQNRKGPLPTAFTNWHVLKFD